MTRAEAIDLLERHTGPVRLCFFPNPHMFVLAAHERNLTNKGAMKAHREFYKVLGIPEWVRKAIYDDASGNNITVDVKLSWIALIEEYQPDIASMLLEAICDSSG